MSASSIAQNGPGPMPASSMTRSPFNGPMTIRSSCGAAASRQGLEFA
jgi:hypothetical protein